MPLNISREMIQQNNVLKVIHKNIVKKYSQNRYKSAEFLRYYSTKSTNELTFLKNYITRIKIRGYEVLLMADPLDKYSVSQFKEYEGKKLVCITKERLEFDGDEKEKKRRKEENKEYDYLCKKIKEILASPCVLVTGQYGWSANFERIMKVQALRDSSMESYMASKNIMEINPQDPIIKSLKPKVETDKNDNFVKDLI
ncbi:Hsp90 protein [Gigaspora rosea]|uniref:Hsp90 protein n=1 Tax=Gigaspora rosea TaxID=44941 RepID=A0A397VGB2_9GLOM|nr:Hsp90 protein [Gigaspora rosea]CAG8508539.1 22373_t:CDS:2 [Gigaspora rosea]